MRYNGCGSEMHLKRLIIKRYRCLQSFTWDPRRGVNCLIGPGDSGKSTVLSAICTLLAPYPIQQASEFDYCRRKVCDGFSIEAFIGGFEPSSLSSDGVIPALWGWLNGEPAPLPDEGGAEAVLHCSVRGTSELELVHEIIGENSQPQPFKVGLRRKLLLARLAGEERSSRDLRLGSGTLLNEFLEPAGIRPAIYAAVSGASSKLSLPAELAKNLSSLGTRFEAEGLPKNLHLGLFPQQGNASTSMVALFTGDKPEESVPVAYSGTGTRQLAVLSLSTADLGQSPILTVDEPERGLESYRQKTLVAKIVNAIGDTGQAFLCTHSPAILAALPEGSVWRMRCGQGPTAFDKSLSRLLKVDPEAFFVPYPAICEGVTEIGFLHAVLPALFGCNLDALGIRLIDGEGQPSVFKTIRAFHEAGLKCAAFLDNEDTHSGCRAEMKEKCGLFVWTGVKNIEEAIASTLPLEHWSDLILTAAGNSNRAKSYEDQMRDCLPAPQPGERPSLPELVDMHGEARVRKALSKAMQDGEWLKSKPIGYKVGRELLQWGLQDNIELAVRAFAKHLPIANDEPRTNAEASAV
jgi:putative ATP-dependent endonuclease of the OLD family